VVTFECFVAMGFRLRSSASVMAECNLV